MIDRELAHRIKQLLNRARTLAEASASQPNPIGRSHPSSRPPAGAWQHETSTLDQIAGRLAAADTEAELREAVDWSEAEIRSVTHSPDREPETREQFRYRVLVEYEGKPARYVADKERVSIALVRQIREAATEPRREPRRGLPIE